MEEIYSEHYPTAEEIKSFVSNLISDTNAILSKPDVSIAERHNAYTNYVISLLMFATGHRPVGDPFCYLHSIDTENNWLLIDDKVVSEGRRFRPAALPEIAKLQLQQYLNHLKYLANILQPRQGIQGQLGDSIANLLDGTNTQTIPLFFSLPQNLSSTQSITSKSIKILWTHYWDEPANFGRKFIATELGRSRHDATLIRVQLGHTESIDHPLGRSSTLEPIQALNQIGEELDQILRSFGWTVLTIKEPKLDRPLSKPRKRKTQYQIHKSKHFGPELRFKKRKDSIRKDQEIVEKHFHRVFPGSASDELTEEKADQVANEIREDAGKQKANVRRCIFVLYRKIRRLSKQKPNLRHFRKIIAIAGEDSPFKRYSCRDYQALGRARTKYLQYLSRQYKESKKPDVEQRLAEIAVCSALFGRVCRKQVLDLVPMAVITGTRRIKDQVFLDFIDSPRKQRAHMGNSKRAQERELAEESPLFTKPDYRWVPDELSLALIFGLYRNRWELPDKYDKQAFNSHKKLLLKEILAPSVKANSRYKVLVDLSQASALMECPGYLRTYATGGRPHTPLPIGALVRISREQRLKTELLKELPEIEQIASWRPHVATVPLENSQEKAIQFKKDLRKKFTESSMQEYERNEGWNRKLRLHLAKSIPDLMESSEWPAIAVALSSWVFNLCREGTRNLANLAFSTVDSYTFMVGTPLLNEQHSVNFLALSEEEYEEIYIRALSYAKRRDVLTIAGRLHEFHLHLIEVWDIDEPDWSVVYLEAGSLDENDYQADANFLTEQDYFYALDLSLGKTERPSLRQYQQAALFVLGYRFGLRFGEAYKAQLRDIQILKDDWSIIFFITRNSIYGNLKTLAGLRHIPLSRHLSSIEREILKQVINAAAIRGDKDIQSALMAQGDCPRDFIPRHELSRDAVDILKFVTGDPFFRFHHLRRSWQMSLFTHLHLGTTDSTKQSILGSICRTPLDNACLIWALGNTTCNRLEDIAKITGHIDTDTTLSSYTHILEWVITDYSILDNYKINNYAWAYALSISENAVKKRKIRYGKEAGALFCPDQSKLIPEFPVETEELDTKSYKPPSEENQLEITPLVIESVLGHIQQAESVTSGLAARCGITQDSLDTIIEAATKLEQQSGYEYYKMFQLKDIAIDLSDADRTGPSSKGPETAEVRSFLNDNQTLLEKARSDPAVSELTALWSHGYHPHLHYIYLANCDRIEVFVKGHNAIGLKDLEYRIVTLDPSSAERYIGKCCDLSNVHGNTKQKLSRRWVKPGVGSLNTVGIEYSTESSQIKRRNSINRITFIISVYLSF